ncbi:hypothetical protein [Paenibacillus sp. NPDC057934]|uniref:hypothetical protein n=1 Tax=Paenibacillus sp. NPDC057934 TaxID=3346282 RepID=UPI0036D8647B
MIISKQEFQVNGFHYTIRSAVKEDAKCLSDVRLQVDGETEHMDRVPGEAFIDEAGFEKIIETDTDHPRNICLVAEVAGQIHGLGGRDTVSLLFRKISCFRSSARSSLLHIGSREQISIDFCYYSGLLYNDFHL